jgi:hypothetical protein
LHGLLARYHKIVNWEPFVKNKVTRMVDSLLSQVQAQGSRAQFKDVAKVLTGVQTDFDAIIDPIEDDWEVLPNTTAWG